MYLQFLHVSHKPKLAMLFMLSVKIYKPFTDIGIVGETTCEVSESDVKIELYPVIAWFVVEEKYSKYVFVKPLMLWFDYSGYMGIHYDVYTDIFVDPKSGEIIHTSLEELLSNYNIIAVVPAKLDMYYVLAWVKDIPFNLGIREVREGDKQHLVREAISVFKKWCEHEKHKNV